MLCRCYDVTVAMTCTVNRMGMAEIAGVDVAGVDKDGVKIL